NGRRIFFPSKDVTWQGQPGCPETRVFRADLNYSRRCKARSNTLPAEWQNFSAVHSRFPKAAHRSSGRMRRTLTEPSADAINFSFVCVCSGRQSEHLPSFSGAEGVSAANAG